MGVCDKNFYAVRLVSYFWFYFESSLPGNEHNDSFLEDLGEAGKYTALELEWNTCEDISIRVFLAEVFFIAEEETVELL